MSDTRNISARQNPRVICYPEVVMSTNNGDKARHNKIQKRRAIARAKIRVIKAELIAAAVAKKAEQPAA